MPNSGKNHQWIVMQTNIFSSLRTLHQSPVSCILKASFLNIPFLRNNPKKKAKNANRLWMFLWCAPRSLTCTEFNYSPIRWTVTTPHRVCVHHSAVIQFYWNCSSSFIFPSGGKIAEWTQYSDPDPAGIKPIRSFCVKTVFPAGGGTPTNPVGGGIDFF